MQLGNPCTYIATVHDLNVAVCHLQNGHWSKCHYIFAAISPTPMAMLVLLAVKGWEGFTMDVGKMPLPAMLAVIGK